MSSSPASPPHALLHCRSLLRQEQTRQHLLGQVRHLLSCHLLPCLSPLGPWPLKPAGTSSSDRLRALTVSSGLSHHIGWGFYRPSPCHVHPGHSLLDFLSKPCLLLLLLLGVCFIYGVPFICTPSSPAMQIAKQEVFRVFVPRVASPVNWTQGRSCCGGMSPLGGSLV